MIGGVDQEEVHSVIESLNGNILVAGATDSYGEGGLDIYLCSFNANGELQWFRTYGSASDNSGWQIGLAEFPNGDLMLTGNDLGIGLGSVFKLNSNGIILWQKNIDCVGNSQQISSKSVHIDEHNQVYITLTSGCGAGASDASVLKLKQNGNFGWMATHSHAHNDHYSDLTFLPNGNLAVIGNAGGFSGLRGGLISVLDSNDGSLIWSTVLDENLGGADLNIRSVYSIGGDDVLVTGRYDVGASSGRDILLARVQLGTGIVWAKRIGTNGLDEGKGIKRKPDGTFLITAALDPLNSDPVVSFINIDQFGNVLSSWMHKSEGKNQAVIASGEFAIIAQNGDLINAVTMSSNGVDDDLWLSRIGSTDFKTCDTLVVTSDPISVPLIFPNWTSSFIGAVGNSNYQVNQYTPDKDSSFCLCGAAAGVNTGIVDTAICEGGAVEVIASNLANYFWFPKDNISCTNCPNPTISPSETTTYYVKDDTVGSCFSIDSLTILVHSPEKIDLGADRTLCDQESFFLEIDSSQADSVFWSSGIKGHQTVITEPGTYQVTTFKHGCEATDEISFSESQDCDCLVVLPNVFSPNNDGLNDAYKTFIDCKLTYYQLKVFNQWGQELFKSNSPEIGWDGLISGKQASEAVYFAELIYSAYGKTERISKAFHLYR